MLNHNKKSTKISILLAAFISVSPISSCSNVGQYTCAENTSGTSSPSGNTTLPIETTNSLPSLSPLDKEFMTKVAQSYMTVIKTSELALDKSKNIAIRKFAEQMKQEYKCSSEQLMKIAKVKVFKLPENIGSENQSLLMSLKQVPSDNFNRAYMNRQVQAHSKTQVEFQKYLQQGQDPDLKAFVSKMSPVIDEHLKKARNIAARL